MLILLEKVRGISTIYKEPHVFYFFGELLLACKILSYCNIVYPL